MKCTIENKYLDTLRSFGEAPVEGVPPSKAYVRYLRICAEGDKVSIMSQAGAADLPSRIERQGVAFIPEQPFLETLGERFTRHWIDVDVTAERVVVNKQRLLLKPSQFRLFDDIASAPTTWHPDPSG